MLKEANSFNGILFFVGCFLFSIDNRAHAKPWQQAIQDVEALREKYVQEIQRRTGERPSLWQGTMNDARDAKPNLSEWLPAVPTCQFPNLWARHAFNTYACRGQFGN